MLDVTLEDGRKLQIRVDYITGVNHHDHPTIQRHVAVTLTGEGFNSATGVAHCHPGDAFVKVHGRTIALDRALRAALPRHERASVWKQLRERGVRVEKPIA